MNSNSIIINNRTANFRRSRAGAFSATDPIVLMKRVIWIFYLLLIFEGALRKWILPGLATPLLIVRDPLAIWLILTSWKQGLFPKNGYVFFMILIGIIGLYTAVFFGHGNLLVAIYGARIMLFHFPLIFVIGQVLNREDILKIGKVTLWISMPITVLIAFQFSSPQSAWVNRGVGGDMNGAGFAAVMDYFRPPATFSFTNGTALFYELVTCFIFYFWINPGYINRILLICATGSLFAAIPLSISRGLFFQFLMSLIFALIAISRKPKYLGKMLLAILGGVILFIILSKTSFFQTATFAFNARFESANEQEGGLQGSLGGRYLGGLTSPIMQSLNQPFWGYGLGMGTNVGSMLLANQRYFLIAEDEWARIIGELGPLMGLSVIFIRLSVSAKLALASYKKLIKDDLLPWMLLSYGLLVIPQIQWAQPTALGFWTIIGGLMFASIQTEQNNETINKVIKVKAL